MSAPVPAPHTPVLFLKAGGSHFFSAECVKALAKFGYEPDDFGGYNHVRRRLKKARDKCKNHPNDPPPVGPTARERELGKPLPEDGGNGVDHYEAGHLQMNTCMQEDRTRACSNYVTGYQYGNSPCMPHQGAAAGPNRTEHRDWTRMEYGTLKQEGVTPRGDYPAEKMDADASARVEAMLRNRGKVVQPTGHEATTGGAATASASGPGAAQTAQGPKPGATASKAPPGPSEDDIKAAAECIDNFRRAAEKAMRDKCKDEEEIKKNQARAGTPEQQKKALAEAKEKRDAAEDAAKKREKGEITDEELKKANMAAGRAQARYTRMKNAECLAQQGQELNAGGGDVNGRYPKPQTFGPPEGTGPGAAAPKEAV